jgi:hypothetical protein
MANWKSDALACPRGAAEPLFVEIHKSLETFGFREPYRICGVQSFREEWVFRRIMSGLCRLGVRSSNEKSLRLLGLIAHKFTRRIRTFGQAGGESVQICIYRPQSHVFADIQETLAPEARVVRRTSRAFAPIRVHSSRMYGPEYGPKRRRKVGAGSRYSYSLAARQHHIAPWLFMDQRPTSPRSPAHEARQGRLDVSN